MNVFVILFYFMTLPFSGTKVVTKVLHTESNYIEIGAKIYSTTKHWNKTNSLLLVI